MSILNPIVFVVHPDATRRASLEALTRRAGWATENLDSAAALLASSARGMPSCLIMDIGSSNHASLDLMPTLTSQRKETPIIATAENGDVPMTVQAMRAGAIEFLARPLTDDVLVPAIRYALARSRAILEQMAALGELRNRYNSLSTREREVMARVVTGHLNKRIGAALGISEITVKAHRGKVMRKMQAGSVAHLVAMALRLELRIDPPSRSPHPGHELFDWSRLVQPSLATQLRGW